MTRQKPSRTKQMKKAVSPAAANAREATVRAADATRDWAAPKVESTVDWAAPKVETAKGWVAPKVEPAYDKIAPAIGAAVASALAATEPVRTEAGHRGAAAVAALKGDVSAPKPKKHRLRKLLLLGTVLGAAYAGWKAYLKRNTDPVDAWTTPSTMSTPPAAPLVTPAGTTMTDDPAGASPDEAIADEADEAEAQAGEGTVDLTTTEPVTKARAKKVSDAAAKGAGKSSSR
jgi:hypothetical protein